MLTQRSLSLPEAFTLGSIPFGEEYVDDSLQEKDALQAMVGAVGGDFMLLQYRLRQTLDETLRENPPRCRTFSDLELSASFFTATPRARCEEFGCFGD